MGRKKKKKNRFFVGMYGDWLFDRDTSVQRINFKLLSDKNEIDSLYGRIAIGYLIVQDIVVVVILIVLSSLHAQHTQMNLGVEIMTLVLKSIGVLTVIALLSRYVLPAFLDWIAKSTELLVLFAIAWAIILAGSAEILGLSREVGGFLAGVSLASTEYRHTLASRLDTLRNFLLLFFFLEVGVKLQFHVIYPEIISVILLSLFVLIGKPIITMIIMGSMGYRKRTSFLTGITAAQISEFSLILAATGLSLQQISNDVVGIITLVGLITFAFSAYLIIYSNTLYGWLEKCLIIFERKNLNQKDSEEGSGAHYDVIIFGIGRYGATIAKILRSLNLTVLGIDFDPQKIYRWQKKKLSVRYGDAEDIGFTKALPIQQAKWIVSTIPSYESNQILMSALKEAHYHGKTAISIFNSRETKNEKDIQTDLKLFPYNDAAEKAAEQIASTILYTHQNDYFRQ